MKSLMVASLYAFIKSITRYDLSLSCVFPIKAHIKHVSMLDVQQTHDCFLAMEGGWIRDKKRHHKPKKIAWWWITSNS